MQKTSDNATKQDIKKLENKIESYQDDVLTKFDAIMKELEEMREDSTLGVFQTRELQEKIDNHEKRIAKLESA